MNGHGKVLNVLGILALVLLRAADPSCDGWDSTPGCSGPVPPSWGIRISLDPTTLTLQPNSTGTVTLTITPLGGLYGTVWLSLDHDPFPCPDPTAWCDVRISPNMVDIPSGSGPVRVPLSVTIGSIPPGTYVLRLNAYAYRLSDSARLVLQVTGP